MALNNLCYLCILKDFRKLREKRELADENDFEQKQYDFLGKQYGVSSEKVKAVVTDWMHTRPLKFVDRYRDKNLIELMNRLKEDGTKIIVYSDYPVSDKAAVIGLNTDYQFYSGDAEISCMKPDPKGLARIVELTGSDVQETLFIGDRYEKDGLCAAALGMDYVILDGSAGKRIKLYGENGLLSLRRE